MSTRVIEILGERIPLRVTGEEDLAERVLQLAQQKIEDVESRVPPMTGGHKIAILALLSLAEENLRAQERVRGYQSNLREKTDRLMELLDS